MNPESTGAITLDEQGCAFAAGECKSDLTGMEFRVLKALAGKPGLLVTRSELQFALYSDKDVAAESNVLEVLVSRLRKKFTAASAAVQIKTIRGAGYKLVGVVQ